MSSVLASFAQVPARVGYFKTNVVSIEGSPNHKFINEPANFTTATGYSGITGNIIYFNSYANATTALTGNSDAPTGETLVDGLFLRDMGKTYHIYVTGVRVATITKVQQYTADSKLTEGVSGLTPVYKTGWVVTWSSDPTTIPVSVVRTGY